MSRENMKSIRRFLLAVFCLAPFGDVFCAGPVATTAGSNLTAYNPTGGAINNNNWASMTNGRSSGVNVPAPKADFGNCNSLIIRCAQPKCSGGGCSDMSVAKSIVSGCVNSSNECKKHGNDLIEYISAQLVAQSSATLQQQQMMAEAQANQNNQQLEVVQQQMQQMQAQNQMAMEQLQNALEEQKNINATMQQQAQENERKSAESVPSSAVPDAVANTSDLTVAQQIAIANNVSPEMLVRKQAKGEIETHIENAEKAMKSMETAMQAAFRYAGCDEFSGDSCTGPKRIRKFKQLLNDALTPYDTALDEMEDALDMALGLGVDVNDIYMMLNNSCNIYARYVCQSGDTNAYSTKEYADAKKEDVDANCIGGVSIATGVTRGGRECVSGHAIPPEDDPRCTNVQMLNTGDSEKSLSWDEFLNPVYGSNANGTANEKSQMRIGCATANIVLGGRRSRRGSAGALDMETFEILIRQDFSDSVAKKDSTGNEIKKYCSDGTTDLQNAIIAKTVTNNMCCTKPEEQKNSCNEACDGSKGYVSPKYAMCSVHVYNTDKTNNDSLSSTDDKDNMRELIGLKSTVMTQQLFKQYNNTERLIKRLKTQLERALLTNELQAAKAASDRAIEESESKSASTDERNGIFIDGAENCSYVYKLDEKLDCIERNYSIIRSESNNGKKMTTPLKKQVGRLYSDMENWMKTINQSLCDTKGFDRCESSKITTTKLYEDCITNFSTYLSNAYQCKTLDERQSKVAFPNH